MSSCISQPSRRLGIDEAIRLTRAYLIVENEVHIFDFGRKDSKFFR